MRGGVAKGIFGFWSAMAFSCHHKTFQVGWDVLLNEAEGGRPGFPVKFY